MTRNKLTPVALAVIRLYGVIDRNFIGMRVWSYLGAGGSMLTMKVV